MKAPATPSLVPAANRGRIFDIDIDSAADQITINNVTLTGGSPGANEDGGAIHFTGRNHGTVADSGNTLNIINSVIRNNRAQDGAGIAVVSGNLQVLNSTIRNNEATIDGGAVFLAGGSMTISGSAIHNNTGSDGGAVYVDGDATIENSSFYSNRTRSPGVDVNPPGFLGGAIVVNAGTTTLRHVTISGNSSATTDGGGGLYKHGGTLNVYNSIIANSTQGDCGFASGQSLNANTGNHFEDATCDGTADGDPNLGAATGSPPHLPLNSGSDAIDNAEDAECLLLPGDAGEIVDQRGYFRPDPAESNCDIGAFEAEATAPQRPIANMNGSNCILADAIAAANSDTAVGDCNAGSGADTITLTDNVILAGELSINSPLTIEGAGFTISAAWSSRIFNLSDATVTINNVTLTGGNPDTDGHGGAIHVSSGTLNLSNSVIRNNQADRRGDNPDTEWHHGGGIYVGAGALNLSNSRIDNNQANRGGGIFVQNLAAITITDSTISNNTGIGGGGLYAYNNVNISGSAISGNNAKNGAGIFCCIDGVSSISDSVISSNIATPVDNNGSPDGGLGGGVYSASDHDGTVNISNSEINNNQAGAGGGLIAVLGTVNISNSTIHSNTATGAGGGIYGYTGTHTLSHVTIANNSAPNGGGIYSRADSGTTPTETQPALTFKLRNSIVSGQREWRRLRRRIGRKYRQFDRGWQLPASGGVGAGGRASGGGQRQSCVGSAERFASILYAVKRQPRH